MIPQDQDFDMSFWAGVLQKTEEDQWEYEGAYIPDRISVCPVTCTLQIHVTEHSIPDIGSYPFRGGFDESEAHLITTCVSA